MKKERQAEVARAIVEIVAGEEQGIRRLDLIKRLEAKIAPRPEERGSYDAHPSLSKFAVQSLFVSAGTVKAGWVKKQNGLWTITTEGREALKTFPDANKFHDKLIELYRAWRKGAAALAEVDSPVIESAAGSLALGEAEEQSATDIQNYLKNLPPQQFEELIGHLLTAMGYHVNYAADGGADGGIDLVAYEDPLGARGARIKVQAKRHQNPVGRPTIQELIGSLSDGETGLIVALTGFTKEAGQFARAHQTKRITLLDGNALVELWIEHYAKVSEEGRLLLRMRPVYFLDLAD
jgi:restriction system protein